MRKASRVLLIISGVFAILAAISLVTSGIFMMVAGSGLLSQLLEAVKAANPDADPEVMQVIEQIVASVQRFSDVGYIPLFFMSFINLLIAIFSFITSGKRVKGLLIVLVIFGFMFNYGLVVLGALFGLFSAGLEETLAAKQEPALAESAPKQVEEQPKEEKKPAKKAQKEEKAPDEDAPKKEKKPTKKEEPAPEVKEEPKKAPAKKAAPKKEEKAEPKAEKEPAKKAPAKKTK